ncbi:MAG: methionine--tRNA ligase, partial [Rhodobacteraceae bacterium]|nr:methionine--tRNA ligase [Paracoccaceae bacterium]
SAAPWAVFKEDPAKAAAIIRLSLNLIRLYAILSAPFTPDASATLLTAMGSDKDNWPANAQAALETLKPGQTFTVPDVLFAKISDEDRESWQSRFSGIRV